MVNDWADLGAAGQRAPAQEWVVWQILDSGFPTGGFAHSGGLEAAVQNGFVKTTDDLVGFLQENLRQTMRTAGPFIAAVFAGRDIAELDWLLDSMLANHVANRASRVQGRALLAIAQRVFPEINLSCWSSDLPGHFTLVFAAIVKALGFTVEKTTRMLLYLTMRGVVSAAVRLGTIGPMHGQRLQAQMAEGCERLVTESLAFNLEDAAQTAPLLDLWQGMQDRLYSRLFQS